jgi:Carboxypeptidase regulatory-like domain/TonB dependent receptor-like, beta-barrel
MYSVSASKLSTVLVVPVLFLALIALSTPVLAQSTFGSFIGTVSDVSGAVVKGATVTLVDVGTSTQRKTITDESGSFSFLNVTAGSYRLTVEAPGFQKVEFRDLDLLARETKRVDATLKAGAITETVNVEGGAIGVITTDVSNIEENRTGQELVDLPVAIETRASGSTSPIATLTTQPGVQTDGSTLVIAGTTSALTAITLDGVSTMNIEYAGPINELFPSFNSISEMKVSGSNNNAEFSGVADVTTTSKAGTNNFHGGVFWNHENAALNAGNPFANTKPKLILNNFGGFAGGPIIRDKTFFFASYEGLRLPRETPIVTSVPTAAMRTGDLRAYLQAAYGPGKQIFNYDGTPLNPAAVPISPVSANILQYLMPAPNPGTGDSFANNYSENLATPISSNQFDVRIDQNLTSKQMIFGRLSYKKRSVTTAPDPYHPFFWEVGGSPSTGPFSQPENDTALTLAHNFTITPSLLNEIRGGFSRFHLQTTLNVNSQDILTNLGLTGIPNVSKYGAVPNVIFGGAVGGFQQTGGANPSTQISNTIQISDNLTWIKHTHTLKFGFDFRRLSDHDDNAFGSIRSGQYAFDGQSSSVGTTIGDPFTSFLLGYPDYELITLINNDKMNGLGYAWGLFAQDDWKVTPSLTLNLGLRYELHPPMKDTGYNNGALLPNYQGDPTKTALVVPNQQAIAMADPGLVGSVPNTPLLTAAQAGIPSALRFTDKKDFGPRIGFAWRPFHNDKTVIRGGYGRFIEAPLGFALVAGWATTTSYIPFYGNGYSNTGTPVISWPAPWPNPIDQAQPGGASFFYAFPVHYKDPSVQQWNLTFEREVGFDTGFRLSYIGNHGSNLEVMQDLNQVQPNNLGYYNGPWQGRSYQDWQIIESVTNGARSNYNSLTADLHKRFGNGLQFESSYVFTRDLSTAGGGNPTSLAVQPANYVTDRFQPNLDYGNVIFDRRHRFLTTYLYELPFGKGKKFLGNAGAVLDGIVGGWETGGVLLFQSGPFLTPVQNSCDSSGTNLISVAGAAHADITRGVSVYAPHGSTSGGYPLFLNPAAFAVPGYDSTTNTCSAIGRFGTAGVGSVVGPGTKSVSMSFIKSVSFAEKAKLQFGAEIANIFNHPNYMPPDMYVGSSGFGTINAVQTAEGAGPRIINITARITF